MSAPATTVKPYLLCAQVVFPFYLAGFRVEAPEVPHGSMEVEQSVMELLGIWFWSEGL
jgi:hypothetical protein